MSDKPTDEQQDTQPGQAPEYTPEQMADRKRRGLHKKGNIGPKTKGPLPRTNPITATFMALLLGVVFVVTTFWTDRNIDFWWTYIKSGMQKGEIDVPLWVSAVTTFVLAPIIIFLNLLSEAFRLFIDFVD